MLFPKTRAMCSSQSEVLNQGNVVIANTRIGSSQPPEAFRLSHANLNVPSSCSENNDRLPDVGIFVFGVDVLRFSVAVYSDTLNGFSLHLGPCGFV
jgi:hypothetical protein